MLKNSKSIFLSRTSRCWSSFSKDPSVRLRFFRSTFFETARFTGRIAPNSCQGQPTKFHLNKCKVVKLCCLFVSGCWSTLQKVIESWKLEKQNMLFMTCCWKSWLLKWKSCRAIGVLQAPWVPPIASHQPIFLLFTQAYWWQRDFSGF